VLKLGRIQGEGSIVFGIQTKFEPLFFMHLMIVENELEMRKLHPPPKGLRTQKNRLE